MRLCYAVQVWTAAEPLEKNQIIEHDHGVYPEARNSDLGRTESYEVMGESISSLRTPPGDTLSVF
jgi:hypothetical protein